MSKQEEFNEAAMYGRDEVIELLLKHKDVDPSFNNNHAIFWASRNGHEKIVKLLLNDGRVDPAADSNDTIREASRYGHDKVVELLKKYKKEDIRRCHCDSKILFNLGCKCRGIS